MSFEEIAKRFSRKNLPESEVELTGEVPYERLGEYRERALKHIASHMELAGFRVGHVPPEVALQKVGESGVLEEALEFFIKDFYPALIAAHAIDAVGRPDIRVTKLATNNPVGLSVRANYYPEVQVPADWKFLHEKVLLEPYTGELPKADPHPSPEEEQKAREYLARDRRRGKLVELLLEKSTVAVPRVFVESEQDKILSQMREDVKRFGLEFGEYLKRLGKTEESIRNEFRQQAANRAKLQLVLNKLANEEKAEANKEAADKEMAHALKHFPDANQALLRVHIETVLRNEKVLQLLEGGAKKE